MSKDFITEFLRGLEVSREDYDFCRNIYKQATFEYKGIKYKMVADKYKGFISEGAALYRYSNRQKDWLYQTTYLSSNGDRGYWYIGGVRITDYKLVAFLLLPKEQTDKLLDTDIKYEINHKTIPYMQHLANKTITAYKSAEYEMLKSLEKLPPHKRKDAKEVFYKVNKRPMQYKKGLYAGDLEVVTRQLNIRHAKFIKKYGLYDMPISANDVPYLETLISNVYVVKVMQDYADYGIEKIMADFYKNLPE